MSAVRGEVIRELFASMPYLVGQFGRVGCARMDVDEFECARELVQVMCTWTTYP